MSSGLAARVIGRLDGESKGGDERWKSLVLAACQRGPRVDFVRHAEKLARSPQVAK